MNSDRARAEHFTCAPRVVVLQGALELYPPAAKQNTCDAESVGAKTIVIAICMPIAKHVPQASSTTMDKLATFTLDEYECDIYRSQRSSLFMCGQVNGWCDRRDVPAQTMTSTGGVMTSTGGVISSIDTAARTNWVVSVVSDNAVLVLLYPRLPHAVLVTAE